MRLGTGHYIHCLVVVSVSMRNLPTDLGGGRVHTPTKRLIKDAARYKTVLCDNWKNNGTCRYGHRCQFAHGADEVRSKVPAPNKLASSADSCPHSTPLIIPQQQPQQHIPLQPTTPLVSPKRGLQAGQLLQTPSRQYTFCHPLPPIIPQSRTSLTNLVDDMENIKDQRILSWLYEPAPKMISKDVVVTETFEEHMVDRLHVLDSLGL